MKKILALLVAPLILVSPNTYAYRAFAFPPNLTSEYQEQQKVKGLARDKRLSAYQECTRIINRAQYIDKYSNYMVEGDRVIKVLDDPYNPSSCPSKTYRLGVTVEEQGMYVMFALESGLLVRYERSVEPLIYDNGIQKRYIKKK